MTVTFVKDNKGVEFGCLAVGDVFVEINDPEDVYIKIPEIVNEFTSFNAVCLQTGTAEKICPDTKVLLLEAELVVSEG